MAAAAAAAACRSAVSHTLIGPPPEFFRVAATVGDKVSAPAAVVTGASAKYAHLVDSTFYTPATATPPLEPPLPPSEKTRTENNSPTFDSSGDPYPDIPAESVAARLAAAWAAKPLTALRLACNLHGVRGTGKSDREGFYAAALWMHASHPKTLSLNARAIAGFGYLKDLPEILHHIIHGGVPTTGPRRHLARKEINEEYDSESEYGSDYEDDGTVAEEDRAAAEEEERKRKAEVSMERQRRRAVAAARALDRYIRDPRYRFLYDCTADVFADHLAEDMRKLAGGELNELSLAAKWCLSMDCSYDQSTLLCEAIGRRLFPKGSSPELPEDLDDRYYAYHVRELLRKQALTPLRAALKVPEVFISDRA
ncbi:unnamed protein product [Urochloa humidicola]